MSIRLTVTFFLCHIVGTSVPDPTNEIQPSASINFTATLSTNGQSGPCQGWASLGTDCYHVFDTFEYFTVAESICQTYKSVLASISSQEENNFVFELIKKQTRYSEAWIGLRYNNKKLVYEWIDGSQLSFKNWIYEKPGPEGYCVEMIPGGKWNNLLCNNQLQFVCKKSIAMASKDDKGLQTIILVSIPVSCVFLMSAFVAYLWIRSVRLISHLPPEDKNNNNSEGEILPPQPSSQDPPPQQSFPQQPMTSIDNEIASSQTLSLDADKSDARDETTMQLYRMVSPVYEPSSTTVRCKDGIYRKVTLV